MLECVSYTVAFLNLVPPINDLRFIDTQSISSMKKHMLRQVPGYELLLLPPYDTQHMEHKSTMDHLVRYFFFFGGIHTQPCLL